MKNMAWEVMFGRFPEVREVHTMKKLTLGIILYCVVLWLYLPLASLPLVQDDHVLMKTYLRSETLVLDTLNPVGKLFYRPIGELYCYGVLHLFGSDPHAIHALSVLMLFLASLVIWRIAWHLTLCDWASWGAAFFYAIQATTHLDSQIWLVGAYENGSMLFGLAALLAAIRQRYQYVALSLALALGFKESAIFWLVPILAYELLVRRKRKWAWWEFSFAGVAGLWLALKQAGTSILSLPADHPYTARLGWHILENCWTYLEWMSSGFQGALAMIVFCILLLSGSQSRIGWFLTIWIFTGLLLPSLFVEHQFRYYASSSLPAAGIVWSMALLSIWGRYGKWALGVFLAIALFFNLEFVLGHMDRGVNDDIPAVNDGYNHLIRKALRGQ